MLDLGQIRNEIDGIDKQLVELFEQRMKLTKEVAEYKIQTGKKVLDREREKAKIESVTKLVKNKENVHAIDDLFSQIMANCLGSSLKFGKTQNQENMLSVLK